MFSSSTTNQPPRRVSSRDPVVRFLEGVRAVAVVWLLVLGLWSAPAPGATLVYANGLLGVEIVLAVVLWLLWLRGRVEPLHRYPFFWPCLAALACWGIAAVIRAHLQQIPFEGLRWWQDGEPMLRGTLLYLAVAGRRQWLPMVWVSLLTGMVLLAGATVVQHWTKVTRWYTDLDAGWAGGYIWVCGTRAQGLTSYINFTAALLASSLPFWLCAAVWHRLRWMRIALAVGGVLTVAALWYTGSRGPALAALLAVLAFPACRAWPWALSALGGMVAFLMLFWWHSPVTAVGALLIGTGMIIFVARSRWRVLLPLALGVCLAGGIQCLDAYVLHLPINARLMEEGVTDAARKAIFTLAVRTALDAPWVGVGEAAFAERLINYPFKGFEFLPCTQHNAHNQPLHWAATIGIPMALVYLGLICWVMVWCVRALRHCADAAIHAFAIAVIVGLSIFLVTNLAEAHFWRMEGGGFFWTLAALAAAFLHPCCLQRSTPP